jgi:hypothetical protein
MTVRERDDRSRAAAFFADLFGAEIRAWRGEAPLAKVFWGYGVAVSGLLAGLYGGALYARRAGLQQVLLLCFAAYSLWVLVSIWNCVENTRHAHWSALARQLTVIWAGNALMLIMFLEIDVLGRLLGG